MKEAFEIYRYSFVYFWKCILIVLFKILYVIFNLLSLVLFIPFLQIIFSDKTIAQSELVKPISAGGFFGTIDYVKDYYQYWMKTMAHDDPTKALLFVCVTVLIAFFLKNLTNYLSIYYQSFVRMAVVRDIRLKLFSKTLNLPLSFYNNERKGDIMTRMNNDVNEIEVAVVALLDLLYRDPLSIIITVATLIYFSPYLTLISFILLPISAFFISKIGKSLKRTAEKSQKELSSLFSNIEENLGAMRIIKAFNAGEFVKERFKKINLHHQKLTTRAFRKGDLTSPLNEFLAVSVLICLVWFGGKMIVGGTSEMNGATFLGFIIVFSQLLVPVQNVAKSITYLSKAKVSLARINELLDTDEKIYEAKNPVDFKQFNDKIEYQDVSFQYNENPVLTDFSLTVPKGKIVALVGESGSGKSTVVDLLPRFYDIQKGAIKIDGTNITEFSLYDLRQQIAYVSQESILFNDTVKNNILFGRPNASDEEVMQAAKIANAHEFITQLEEGYDTIIGERGGKLSGGQRQRINIARAVLKNAPILILDEATSALDLESEHFVQQALDQLMKDKTSIVIAHRLSTIKNADLIVVMNKGQIVEQGTHEELLKLQGAYYKLFTMQF